MVANDHPNRIFKLLVQGFIHYGGASGQVGISASEAQPARPNFFCAILISNDLNYL